MSQKKLSSMALRHTKIVKHKKGFTLIELLVVIGIIGILAAALIAVVNPVEQLNKANDTAQKLTASQFAGAATRYYMTRGGLPWHATANGGSNCYAASTTPSAVALTTMTACVTAMVSAGELKQSFTSSSNMSTIYVTNPNPITGSTYQTAVCFQPKSDAQQKDTNTRYAQTGATGVNCKSQGGTANCYYCEP